MTGQVAVAAFVVSLLAAILFHEFAHFWTARRFGMRADRFFVGFGPTLWSTRRGETEYGLKALPAGGFVRIRGMMPDDERRAPLLEAVLGADVLAAGEDTPEQAPRPEDTEDDPRLPEGTWERLIRELHVRGAGDELTQRIVERTRRNVGADAGVREVRCALHEVLATEVTDTGRIGDLHHRLMKGDEGRFFADRPAWQRVIVLISGPATHVLLAIVLLFGGFALLPQPTDEVAPVVERVMPSSPAAQAGLQPGDRIVRVGEVTSQDFTDLRDAIRRRAGEPTVIVVERDGQRVELQATPTTATDEQTGEAQGQLGFLARRVAERLGPGEALRRTFVGDNGIIRMTGQTVVGLGQVFGPQGLESIFSQVAGEEERGRSGAVSVVGAADVAGEGAEQLGWMVLVVLLAVVNVFLGIFNLLPLPPLDGGHLAVLGIERGVNAVRGWRGRPTNFAVDPRAIAAIAVPVIVLLAVVSVALVWLDITNPVRLQ